MATPEFILRLRQKIGHDQLWLPGVTIITVREHMQRGVETLLVQTHTGLWKPVTGIIDPGEQPDDAAVRETREETGIDVTIRRVLAVESLTPMQFDNGDKCIFLDIAVYATADDSHQDPAVGDDENKDARWFSLDALPELDKRYLGLLVDALREGETRLGRSPECR